MCESRVFIEKNGEQKHVMDSVVIIRPEGEKLFLVNLLGEQKLVDAKIKEVKLLEHKIILEE